MDIKSTKKLNNGVEIPRFGLGVFRSPEGEETANAVRWALQNGYIHIDTAKIYGNEKSVGEGVRTSGAPREKIFVTTKLWNQDQRDHRQRAGFDESLKALGMEYVDLYLIHWPVDNFIESWRVMEEIYAEGKAKTIGVSNFNPHHLDRLLEKAKVVPAVNQIEMHPYLTQEKVLEYCVDKGIAVEAWSPLGGQGNDVMGDPVLKDLSARHGKTPAQVIVRWHLQRDVIVIPKSVREARIRENCDVYDFSLSGEEMSAISGLNKDRRNGSDPDNFNF